MPKPVAFTVHNVIQHCYDWFLAKGGVMIENHLLRDESNGSSSTIRIQISNGLCFRFSNKTSGSFVNLNWTWSQNFQSHFSLIFGMFRITCRPHGCSWTKTDPISSLWLLYRFCFLPYDYGLMCRCFSRHSSLLFIQLPLLLSFSRLVHSGQSTCSFLRLQF